MKIEKIPIYLFSYRKSYYLTRPWKFFRELWIGAKNLWHRARYGYAYVDAWNMSSAWCLMGANMMLHLAQHGSAYPGGGEFDTPEKWKAHLEDMAQRLRECANIDWDEKNEYKESFLKDWKNEELRKKYYTRMSELQEEHDELVKETFKILGHNFNLYWD